MEVKKITEGMTAPQVAQVIDDNFKGLNEEKANKVETDEKLSELGSEVQDNRLFVGNNTKSFEWNEVGTNWESSIFVTPIKKGKTYIFRYKTTESDRNSVFFFTGDLNKSVIQYIRKPSEREFGNAEVKFVAENDARGIIIQTDVVLNSSIFDVELVYENNLLDGIEKFSKEADILNQLANKLNDMVVNPTYTLMPSGYINHSTGQYESIEGYAATDYIPIITGFKYLYSGKAEYAVANYAFYDDNRNFISAVPIYDGNILTDYILDNIPSNAKYVRFSGIESTFKLRIISPYNNSYGFNPIPGYVNYHNGIFEELVTDKYCATEFILLDDSKDYLYSGKAEYGGANYAFYDSDKNFISAVTTSDGSQLYNHKVDNIPSNAKYVRFSGIATTFKLSIENKVPLPLSISLPKLANKTILFNGDSLCESRLDSSKNEYNGGAYAKLISDRVGCIYHNRGRSGAVLISGASPSGYNPERHIVDDVKNMQQDCDIICFEGGINDWSSDVPIGEVSSYFSRDFDETTVIGALEGIFYQAKVKWTGKPIVFIISHQCRGASWKKNTAEVPYTFAELRDKMIEVCNKWSIPYFDAFAKSGLNGNLDEYGKYLNSNPTGVVDGWHPNKEAYERFYVPQLSVLLESLV